MAKAQKPILLIGGKEYKIELYPRKKRVSANYLGKIESKEFGEQRVFSNQNNYILVDNHWMIQKQGVITYMPISSASVGVINKEELRFSSRLVKMLKQLGEQI